ncbi:hypothetical protein KY332_02250 [Candidatus Woesearchaeota archaeon]|nr:hypothetical protein [Candidatus Woesearchaeota archaeon]
MKSKILIPIFLLLLLSSGCQFRKTPSLEPEVIEYHKGTDGLVMEFVKNLPPKEIIEGTDFALAIEIRNKGAYDIKGAKISISGYDPRQVVVSPREIYFDIQGKQPGFPEGGYEIANFQVQNKAVLDIEEEIPMTFRAVATYRYETEAGAEVCINPNVYSYLEKRDIVCEPGEILLKEGQGAPVALTRVAESFAPSGNKMKISFILSFANKGDGEVITPVQVKEVRLANAPLSCTQNSVELREKEESSIICTREILISEGTHISPLSVKLMYDYSSNLDKLTKIKALR